MAIERKINLVADTSQAVREVDKLDNSLKDVSTQSKKTSTSLEKVGDNGGAIAVLDSVTGGLATRMRDAFEATKLFNFSLKGTRTALIATGIGAFVVALGLVVAYWDDIVEFITGANKKLQEQITLLNTIRDRGNAALALLDAQEKLLIAQGKSTEDISKKRRKILLLQIESNRQSIIALQTQLETEKKQAKELSFWQKVAALSAQVRTGDYSKFKGSISSEEADRLNQIKKDLDDARITAEKLQLLLFQIDNPEKEKGDGVVRGKVAAVGGISPVEAEAQTLEEIQKLKDLEAERDLKRIEDGFLERVRMSDAEVALQKEKNAKIKADEENLKNAKIAIAGQTLNILGSLAKEGSALAKGIAASQAVINTFQGVTAALSATSVIPDPFGTILKFANAFAIGISGAINVKNILKTKPVTTSAPSGGGTGGAPPAPSFNLVQGSASNQIADSIQGQNKPIKAFVTSKDVTSGQEMDRNIEANAAL